MLPYQNKNALLFMFLQAKFVNNVQACNFCTVNSIFLICIVIKRIFIQIIRFQFQSTEIFHMKHTMISLVKGLNTLKSQTGLAKFF